MKKVFFFCNIIVLNLLNPLMTFSSDQIPGRRQERPVALVGGMIHPVNGETLKKGTLVFDQGKITAIGKEISIPQGAESIDISGKHLYPGLISGNTTMGLTEIGAVRATRDMTETGRINPNVRAEVAVNPESELIPVTRANGITSVVTAPRGGLISGTSALIHLDGWTWEEMTVKAPLALNVNWPSMTTIRAWWMEKSEEEQRKDREKALNELDLAMKEARAYWVAKKARGKVKTDLRWEAMIPVFERELPVVVWANEIQQIQAAVAWAEREKFKLIIGGGYDAWRVTDLLKRKDIPVLIGGVHRNPSRRWEEYDLPFALPSKLYEAGVRFCIASGGWTSNERNLPYHAAKAAAYGLPKEEALKAVTLYPAQIFGVDDRMGSLEVGKDATLIVTTGDPLEITTQVEMEFIEGKRVDLSSRHTMLYEKYQEKYRRLRED
ncbi:amidohydrolase family protein [candidate division TA06 bacterium]|nr:amidohydrolase family protein [candidate division TA06 bacterium]